MFLPAFIWVFVWHIGFNLSRQYRVFSAPYGVRGSYNLNPQAIKLLTDGTLSWVSENIYSYPSFLALITRARMRRFCNPLPRWYKRMPARLRYPQSIHRLEGVNPANPAGCLFLSYIIHHQPLVKSGSSSAGRQCLCKPTSVLTTPEFFVSTCWMV